MIWPFKSKPEIEQRSSGGLTLDYMTHRRKGLTSQGNVALSATVGTAIGVWSRAFAMLDVLPEPVPANVLAQVGADLLLKGESCWHIRTNGSDLDLVPVAYWDELGNGKYHLHLARVNSTETIRAIEGEVLKLTINSDTSQPWRGRSPFTLMGLSPTLLAEIENAVSGALPMAGKGVLPMPSTIAPEEKAKTLSGLQNGSLAVVTSKADFAHQTGGERSEMRRVELTPDLQRLDINKFTDDLHTRLLTGAGIPAALMTPNGNAGAMREAYRLFALQTVQPLARQILPEFTRKLNVSGISLDAMMSSDVAGRARAVGVLTKAGVDLNKAMKLVGWSNE